MPLDVPPLELGIAPELLAVELPEPLPELLVLAPESPLPREPVLGPVELLEQPAVYAATETVKQTTRPKGCLNFTRSS
jgi:hypothetical protein